MLDLDRVNQALRDVAHVANEAGLDEADVRHLHITLGILDEVRDDNAGIELRIDADEASALASVLGNVGGHPDYTRRRHIDTLAAKLAALGFEYKTHGGDTAGSVYFE